MLSARQQASPPPDDTDHADRWQFVYGRFVPAVLANAGDDPVRFELKLAKAEQVKSVSVGMSSTYFRAEWAPDQLEIDGKPLAKDPLELFYDGTHGDVIAGDHVYSRSGITTHMAIRSDGGESNGKRCRVLVVAERCRWQRQKAAAPLRSCGRGLSRHR